MIRIFFQTSVKKKKFNVRYNDIYFVNLIHLRFCNYRRVLGCSLEGIKGDKKGIFVWKSGRTYTARKAPPPPTQLGENKLLFYASTLEHLINR